MKKILIKSLNDEGMNKLNEMFSENIRESIQQRATRLLTGYNDTLISKNPCIIEITFSQKFMNHPAFIISLPDVISKITNQIDKYEIKNNIDYCIEVI